MRRRFYSRLILISLVMSVIFTACQTSSMPNPEVKTPLEDPVTPFIPATKTPLPTETPAPDLSFWIDPAIPPVLSNRLQLPQQIRKVENPEPTTFRLEVPRAGENDVKAIQTIPWVLALVAPFPTLTDGVSTAEWLAAWQGNASGEFAGRPILMDAATRALLTARFGEPAEAAIQVLPADQILDEAWNHRPAWAVIPFETLEARWKVIRIDGVSPLDRTLDASVYPLAIPLRLSGPEPLADTFKKLLSSSPEHQLPGLSSNRDENKLTVLVMTGVTALVRATAWQMETKGVTFPANDVRDWLASADITHISNEVSFAQNCPFPDRGSASLRFCSDPKYIDLLENVGADVIELTGNHLNDWGRDALLFSLDLYKQHHFQVYAGGANLEEARQPLVIEDHGNRIAFIGCNPAGPADDWATADQPGAAPCDLDWEAAEISRLRADGILPIATFQYFEAYDFVPMPWQQRDFRKVSDAGAVIVSGSQAHYPQTYELNAQGGMIHYGLGNLFFDQMNVIMNDRLITGTRWEFIDRHYFYDGRYLGTEVLTAMLEDYARPRPMTSEERASLLSSIFQASGW